VLLLAPGRQGGSEGVVVVRLAAVEASDVTVGPGVWVPLVGAAAEVAELLVGLSLALVDAAPVQLQVGDAEGSVVALVARELRADQRDGRVIGLRVAKGGRPRGGRGEHGGVGLRKGACRGHGRSAMSVHPQRGGHQKCHLMNEIR